MNDRQRIRTGRRALAWLVVVAAVVLSSLGILAVVAIRALLVLPRLLPIPRDDGPKPPAESFLREGAKSLFTPACLNVIDNGGVLNPCADHLRDRPDLHTITDVDEKVRVLHAEINGDRATVTSADLRPRPGWDLTIGLRRTNEGWRVRSLNGKPILYRWEDWKYKDGPPR